MEERRGEEGHEGKGGLRGDGARGARVLTKGPKQMRGESRLMEARAAGDQGGATRG